MKILINRPESVVDELGEGLALLHPGLRRLPGWNVMSGPTPTPRERRAVACQAVD